MRPVFSQSVCKVTAFIHNIFGHKELLLLFLHYLTFTHPENRPLAPSCTDTRCEKGLFAVRESIYRDARKAFSQGQKGLLARLHQATCFVACISCLADTMIWANDKPDICYSQAHNLRPQPSSENSAKASLSASKTNNWLTISSVFHKKIVILPENQNHSY